MHGEEDVTFLSKIFASCWQLRLVAYAHPQNTYKILQELEGDSLNILRNPSHRSSGKLLFLVSIDFV